jgi:hypothetical protein
MTTTDRCNQQTWVRYNTVPECILVTCLACAWTMQAPTEATGARTWLHIQLLFVSKMSRRQAIIGGQGHSLKCLLCRALAVVCTAAVAALCRLRRLRTPAQLHNGTQQGRSCPEGRPGRGEGTCWLVALFGGHFSVRLATHAAYSHAHHAWQLVINNVPI